MTKKEVLAVSGGFLGGLAFYFILGGLFLLAFGKETAWAYFGLAFGVHMCRALYRWHWKKAWRQKQYQTWRKKWWWRLDWIEDVVGFSLLTLAVILLDPRNILVSILQEVWAYLLIVPAALAVGGVWQPQRTRWKLRKIPYFGKSPHSEKRYLIFWASVGLLCASVMGVILFL